MDKKIIIGTIVVSLVILVGSYFLLVNQEKAPPIPKEQIVSTSGIHWHPHLSIIIKDKEIDISKDIGIAAVHNPIHTHDSTGTIHLEFSGLVTKDDIRLKQFFKVWGKQFNSKCIFDKCNSSEGKVKLTINGKESNDSENYIMRDKDRIVIKFD